MKIFRISDLPVNIWSGGTTQQLAIFPESATLAERNFDVRISTATVTDEESVFTNFGGFTRDLFILEGRLEIVHETPDGTIRKKLEPLHSTRFDGSWKTSAKGKVRDFNVIFRQHLKVETKVLRSGTVEFSGDGTVFLFVVQGSAALHNPDSDKMELKSGECALFSGEKGSIELQPEAICIVSLIQA